MSTVSAAQRKKGSGERRLAPRLGQRYHPRPMLPARDLFSYRKYWASRFGTAPFLPMSREEMEALGWDSCDIIIVTGDAYVDHPSFGMAIVGRVLEAQGFRVGIIAQPDWRSAADFARLGRPNLFFGITAGNMDSMVNRYTSDRRIRSDDAYTPDGAGGSRPDRSVIVYAQRAREAFPDDADRDRRHRGEPAPHRALRLLVGESAPLDPARREGRPARVRQRRAADRRDRAPAREGREHRRDHRSARHCLRAPRDAAGLDGNRFDHDRRAGQVESADGSVRDGRRRGRERAERSRLQDAGAAARQEPVQGREVLPPRADVASARNSVIRMPPLRGGARRCGAVRARVAHPSSRIEPGQRARTGAASRRRRRVAQSAAAAAYDEGDGCDLRAAVPARAASVLRQGEDPRVPDDPLLDRDPARLLRRLHVLLDHRARGPHHPEPLGRTRSSRRSRPCATRCRASPA